MLALAVFPTCIIYDDPWDIVTLTWSLVLPNPSEERSFLIQNIR